MNCTDPAVLWKNANTCIINGTNEALRNARACLSTFINIKLKEDYANDLVKLNKLIIAHASLTSVLEKLIAYATTHPGDPEFKKLDDYKAELSVVKENWKDLQMVGTEAPAAPANDAPPVYTTASPSNGKTETFFTLLTDAHSALKNGRMRDAIDIFEKKLRFTVHIGAAAAKEYPLNNHTLLFQVKLELGKQRVIPQDLMDALLSGEDYFVTRTRDDNKTLYISIKGGFYRLVFKSHKKDPLMICFLVCEYLG
jgi:hypothetical protein